MSTNWSPRALDLLHKRYFAFQQDLTIDEWLDKVTQHYVSYYTNSDEKNIWQGHYKDLLARRAFFPTSAALINPLRAPNLGLSGCMVIPIEKTLREINSITKVAILNALLDGIGVGLDLSELPPRLSPDDASGRAFPGPVEILRSIVLSTKPLVDYSGVKRAAYMASLSAEHPDIFSFSRVKMDYEISDANISVAISPDFNQAFNAGEMLLCKYGYGDSARVLTRDDLAQMHALAVSRGVPAPDLQITNEGKVFSSAANRIVGNTQSDGRVMLDPTEILKFIAECAHRKGDPGLLNLDVINDFNPTKDFNVQANGRGLIRTTTPCGEQPLLPYEVCHLGSISLPHYLGSGKAFDYNSLKKDISIIVRMMDDIVEVSDNGSQNSNSVSKSNRKIGIGIMGLADVLVSRGFAYDSEQAHTFSSDLQRFIQEECALVSEKLAEERGPFPNWQYSIYKDGKPRRNATLTTIAPTGHISVLADCSTSIEPHFSHSYVRKAAGDHHETVSVLQDELSFLGYSLGAWIQDTQQQKSGYVFDGSLQGLTDTPTTDLALNKQISSLKKIFKVSHEITPSDHLKMVSILQAHVENGISKTINLSNSATIEDVHEIFVVALQMRLKGITIFRDGCLEVQALKTNIAKEEQLACRINGECGPYIG